MASVIGNLIVIIILGVILFFAGRSTVRQLRKELKGEGCSGCSGSCGGCSKCSTRKNK